MLKGLIGTTYDKFDMLSFDNRLKLQKFFYIMQHMFDLNVGYEFKWYTYGPYCTELTKDGFIVDKFENPLKVNFGDEKQQERFEKFVLFIKEFKDDIWWLEVVSSIHLLKKIYPNQTKEEIVKEVMDKREQLKSDKKEITKIYEDLQKGGFLE